MNLREWFSRARAAFAPHNALDVSNLTPIEFARLLDSWGAGASASGVIVTPDSAGRAIPVKACCTLIAGGIVSMPLRILKREVKKGRFVAEPVDDHPLWWLFNESPNDDEAAASLWQRIVWDLLLRGEAMVRIVRPLRGLTVQALRWYPRQLVEVERAWDAATRVTRTVSYSVTDRESGRTFGVLPEDMLHFRTELAQRPIGGASWSAIFESTREAIGILLAIEQFAGRAFLNGGTARNVIGYPQGVAPTRDQQDLLREAWIKRYGGIDNSHVPLILTNGAAVSKLSLTAQELQMVEAWKLQVSNIAAGFNVPPWMIGETDKATSWGSGIEQMSKGFIRYTLGPIITAIEQELNRKLFGIARYACDFDEEALDRGDMKSLGEWFRQAIGGSQGPGFMTINEVRSRVKLPPIEGGEELYDPKGATPDDSGKPSAAADPAEPDDPAPVPDRGES